MAEDDAQRAGADRAGRQDEVHLLQLQDRRPHESRVKGYRDDADRDHRVAQARPERGDDCDGQDQTGEGEEGVDHAHQQEVGDAAGVAAHEPDQAAPDKPHGDGHESHRKRDTRPPQHPAQQVASELIRAEDVSWAQRWQVRVVGVDGKRIVRRDHG